MGYKYRSLDFLGEKAKKEDRKEGIKRLKSLLNCSWYFASPRELNDPYECRPTLSYSLEGIKNLYKRFEEEHGFILHNEVHKSIDKAVYPNIEKLFIDGINSKIGIFCMSKSPEISTQWTYYSSNHTGLCIEYDLSLPEFDPNNGWKVHQVSYMNSRPSLPLETFLQQKPHAMQSLTEALKTKSIQWEHEKEIRIFYSGGGGKCFDMPVNNIRKVIFGLRTEEKHKEFIYKLTKEMRLNVEFGQIESSDSTFALKVTPVINRC